MTFVKRSLSIAVLISFGSFAACGTSPDEESTPLARPQGANQSRPSIPTPNLRSPMAGGHSQQLGTSGNVARPNPLTPVDDEVVVQLRPQQPGSSVGGRQLLSAKLSGAARNIRSAQNQRANVGAGSSDIVTVEIDRASGQTVDSVIANLKQLPEVEFAEPNYRYEAFATPNDPLFASQPHLAQIRAPQAWDVTTGSTSVVVAVIDTGVEIGHADLAANIWRNPGEIASNGVDDDGNGLVDDVTGYDFVSATSGVAPDEDPGPPDNNPADVFGHGTHVAGIVGAVGNNGNGVAGVAWTVKLMPLRAGYKTTGGQGTFQLSDIATALRYAADKGAHVVNMSFGGPQASLILADALKYAADRNVLLVAAAGNTGGSTPQWPAANDRVLSVAAMEDLNLLALFSSYGTWVDVAAPGFNVLSTTIGGTTGLNSGTSMASPVVAGIAALVRASHPLWTGQQIAEKITSSTFPTTSSARKHFGIGFVDASAAVTVPGALATFDVVRAQFEEVTGDGDGNVEPGESGRLHATVKNYGPAGSAIVTLQTSQSGVTVSGSPVTLAAFGHTRLSTATFSFTLPSNLPANQTVPFNVTVTSGSRSFVEALSLEPVRWAPPRVLSDKWSQFHSITGLSNGAIVVVTETDGGGTVPNGIAGIVKSPTGTWSALTQLNNSAGDAHQPNTRAAPDGSLDVTYERNVGNLNYQIFYRRYTPSTNSWGTAEEQVTTNAVIFNNQTFDHVRSNYAVARDTTGRLHVAWVDSAGLPRTVRYTTRASTGSWSAPVTIATFAETDLLEARLEMFVLPDNSRRLVVQRFAPASLGVGVYREVVLSGTGTTWQAAVTSPSFFDGHFPPFLQGSNVYKVIKRTSVTDSIELVRWSGTTWVADRVISGNITGNAAVMAMASSFAMSSSTQFGVLTQDTLESGPYDYFSGTAGALTSIRATARPDLATAIPKLWVASNGTAHAIYSQHPVTSGFILSGQLTYQSSAPDAGMVLPAKPTVSATLTSQAFNTSWTIANPSQVSRYLVAAGTSPGSDDLVPWTPVTTTSFAAVLSERPPQTGETFYASVRAISTSGHAGPIGFSPGVTLAACTPETNAQFCTRLGKNCGSVTGTDNCGAARTVSSCGTCTSPATCGGGGTPNVCGTACTPETNAQFCTRLAKNCGSVTGTDNCGASRTVSSCGTCTSPQTCGGGGTANVCGGGGTSTPCTNLCTNPTVFTGPNFQSNNLGTAATCHQTVANLSGLVCGNFATGRTFRVNGTVINCSSATLPPKVNGGYCFQSTAGDFAWAYFSTW